MSWMLWMGVGGVVVVAVAVLAWVRRGRDYQQDLGTISGQWINERRLQERESNDR